MRNLAIKAINLTKRFGKSVAVDHINFEVYEGEIFGFLGPNGAGKSTTIKMLTTVLTPSEGTAIVNGYDVIKQPAHVRQSIGVVPQEYTADEDLTGWENMMMMAGLYGIPKKVAEERSKELLEMVELTYAAKRKVETYSGGMRRRLEIAMSLISRPRILFLDEPTLGLDAQTRAAIWQYIMKLKEEYKMTIFVTTHYLEEADMYGDRIAIIDKGKILAIGSPKELKEKIGGDLVSLQTNNDELAIKVVSSIDGILNVKKANDGIRIKVRNGEEKAPEILESLVKNGIKVSRMSITEPTMDEVYMEFTGKRLRDEDASAQEMFAFRRTMRRART
ncbi:daunorubicin resistance ABC transporter ATPase subunit [Sulfolobus islandicus Y.G.57.14]|uniref:Daunorubicin resistance ABC transporter ATPase subunit n=3 Tax=Saccharolobus islandicus TaxID=43080 RepID=C3MKX0_SACI2|nr:ATP-binding cassette domain-containing protein [Sulfolobus islandicus]ACP34495.1 daunorubicin resistance ABC transporter ATPase subunit [Sulfolobus islandicus L.S.2.15]ACP44614.1 daunorubicin resistance ABC transporter ATPase subunit [Sulfolobus islandicus Y.G.57.14]ADB86121.1 daunorubicin resistance ABC transporter ATPase subunit [Sulfolobus islandicus L.D.8.5]